jgi:hypothetical protein
MYTHFFFLRQVFLRPPVARRLCSESREIPAATVPKQSTYGPLNDCRKAAACCVQTRASAAKDASRRLVFLLRTHPWLTKTPERFLGAKKEGELSVHRSFDEQAARWFCLAEPVPLRTLPIPSV